MTNNLHAHVDTYAVDCDGPIERSYILSMRAEEQDAEFGDIEFRERVLCNIVSPYITWQGTLTVTGDEMGGLTKILDWSEQTEEGRRSARAEFCTDDCDTGASSYRDIRAEQAGY